jgi:hypothetical protein
VTDSGADASGSDKPDFDSAAGMGGPKRVLKSRGGGVPVLLRKGSKKEELAKAGVSAVAAERRATAQEAEEAEAAALLIESARRIALASECRYLTVQVGTCEQYVDLHTEKDLFKRIHGDGTESELKSVVGALFTRPHLGVMVKVVQDVLDRLNRDTLASVAIVGHP